MTTKQKRELPADVYDSLELSALIHGGIGSSCLFDKRYDTARAEFGEKVPVCIMGHAMFLDGYSTLDTEDGIQQGKSPVTDALVAAFPDLIQASSAYGDDYRRGIREIERTNDHNVGTFAVNEIGTLTWKQWCRALGVVRAAA